MLTVLFDGMCRQNQHIAMNSVAMSLDTGRLNDKCVQRTVASSSVIEPSTQRPAMALDQFAFFIG